MARLYSFALPINIGSQDACFRVQRVLESKNWHSVSLEEGLFLDPCVWLEFSVASTNNGQQASFGNPCTAMFSLSTLQFYPLQNIKRDDMKRGLQFDSNPKMMPKRISTLSKSTLLTYLSRELNLSEDKFKLDTVKEVYVPFWHVRVRSKEKTLNLRVCAYSGMVLDADKVPQIPKSATQLFDEVVTDIKKPSAYPKYLREFFYMILKSIKEANRLFGRLSTSKVSFHGHALTLLLIFLLFVVLLITLRI
jgi:hypothetical protein